MDQQIIRVCADWIISYQYKRGEPSFNIPVPDKELINYLTITLKEEKDVNGDVGEHYKVIAKYPNGEKHTYLVRYDAVKEALEKKVIKL
jgi:hypothetical protein